jgi:hypothetical protein
MPKNKYLIYSSTVAKVSVPALHHFLAITQLESNELRLSIYHLKAHGVLYKMIFLDFMISNFKNNYVPLSEISRNFAGRASFSTSRSFMFT